MGTWTLRDDVARQNVCQALRRGFRLIDTAQMYDNEQEVGDGIRMSGIPRAKPNHFDENLEVMEFALSADDMAAIDALNINLRSNKDNDPETFPW